MPTGSVSLSPTTSSQSAADWANTNGVFGPTGSPATALITGTAPSGTISFGGFPANGLPTNATILGISFGGAAWASNAGDVGTDNIGLTINGHSSGNLSTGSVLSTTPGSGVGYGSSTTQPGALAATAADINTGTISGSLQFIGLVGNSGTNVDVANWGIVVYYSVPGDPDELLASRVHMSQP